MTDPSLTKLGRVRNKRMFDQTLQNCFLNCAIVRIDVNCLKKFYEAPRDGEKFRMESSPAFASRFDWTVLAGYYIL